MSNSNFFGVPGRSPMMRLLSNDSVVTNESITSDASDLSSSPASNIADTQHGLHPNTIPSQFPLRSNIPNSTGSSIRENEPLPHPADSAPIITQSSNSANSYISEQSSSSPFRVATVVAPTAAVAIAKMPTANELIDRQERAIAALLTRFKNLVLLAALPTEDAFTKETAAAEGLRMEVESNALTSAAEDLLKLTRELKELWTFGSLREIGEGEGDGEMEADSMKVAELIEKQLEKKHEQEKNKV